MHAEMSHNQNYWLGKNLCRGGGGGEAATKDNTCITLSSSSFFSFLYFCKFLVGQMPAYLKGCNTPGMPVEHGTSFFNLSDRTQDKERGDNCGLSWQHLDPKSSVYVNYFAHSISTSQICRSESWALQCTEMLFQSDICHQPPTNN